MKKILLTGGSGFVGRNVAESYLAETYQIMAPRRAELDLFDEKSVEQFFKNREFDVVIHAACKPAHRNASDLSGIFHGNCRMFFNLLKYQNSFGRLIDIGSGSVYDLRNYQPKMSEEFFGKFIPADEFGFAKYVIGNIAENSQKIVDLRVFGIFGKYEDYSIRFISNAICKAIFDLPITIKQNRKFDYIHVNDLMPILEFFIENDSCYRAYNVTPNKSVELLEIVKTIAEISQKNPAIKISEAGLGLEYSGDNSRLKREMSGLKFTDLTTSISNLYAWYLSNQSLIDREKLLTDK